MVSQMYRASCLMLEIKEFRSYEVKIEESEKASSHRESNPGHFWLEPPAKNTHTEDCRVGGCPAVVAQWQSTAGLSRRCPGFDSR